MDVTIEICGMSGDGTIATGMLFNQAMSASGFSVIAFDSYPAEIRGFGMCVARVRVGDEVYHGLSDSTDILLSLDDSQARSRVSMLTEEATIFFDNRPSENIPETRSIAGHVEPEMRLLGVPLSELASKSGGVRGRNIVALGALAGFLHVPASYFQKALKEKFGGKGSEVLDTNIKCFDAGYNFVQEKKEPIFKSPLKLPGPEGGKEKVLLSGNEAISRGAIDAGLKAYFGYPITPATPIMEYLAKNLPEKGGEVVQMEDEIASLGAVLGCFYAGKRAMTATSGPGLSLMTEFITYGIEAEIPAVILNAQRGGPSTGLPTKTEQSDLHAAVYGGPGDSPRIVLAPTNVSKCYEITLKAFQLAEKYQTPVIILTDFFLNNRVENVVRPVPGEGALADAKVYAVRSKGEPYMRYTDTPSGISPVSLPGTPDCLFNITGLEHSEGGNPDFTPENHIKMSGKRHRKINGSLKDLPKPEEFSRSETFDIGVISWGSTFGAALEAVQKSEKSGRKVAALKVSSL
ncbi:MAG: 2-oxoacid:acceptor oxidoreductase subunit alpha [Nitrospinota bacterium]